MEAYGSYSELLSSGFDTQHLLGLVSAKEVEEGEHDIFLCKEEANGVMSFFPASILY